MEIKPDFLPVRFMGGTGGNFLVSWLTQAKLKSSEDFQFSLHGNCHTQLREYRLHERPFRAEYPLRNQLEGIDEIAFTTQPITTPPPYFVCSECVDLHNLISRYPRVISITYDLKDSDQLAWILLGKWGLDENESARRFGDIVELKDARDTITKWIDWRRYYRQHHHLFDSNQFTPTDNSIAVTWQELFELDPMLIKYKLSKFTGFAPVDFPTKNILAWRAATLKGIELTKQQGGL